MERTYDLTRGEETLMELFWEKDCPLTGADLFQMTEKFNESYIHRLLNSLQEKGVIKVEGVVRSGKKYAREFIPLITREEYGAYTMERLGVKDEKSIAKIAVALIQKPSDKEKLVQELEKIVEEIKKA